MVDRLGHAAAVDAQLVGDAGQVFEVLAKFQAALADLAELERALHEVTLAAFHRRSELVLAHELGHVELIQFRLGVERVDVAGPAIHHEKDAGFRFGGMIGRLGRQDAGVRFIPAEQRRERHAAQARSRAVEKIAARIPKRHK